MKLGLNLKKTFLLPAFLLFLITVNTGKLFAQDTPAVVQVTGIVLGELDRQLPGVHVFVPKGGRGTTTNIYGYFSMPALVGDSIVFSSVGYERFSYIVPGDQKRVNVLVKLQVDTTYLENVDITPFLSEENFKEAILALELPKEEEILRGRLDGEMMALMMRSAPYDAALSARYYLDQQIYYQQDKYSPRSNPLLDPFRWQKFIQSLKKK